MSASTESRDVEGLGPPDAAAVDPAGTIEFGGPGAIRNWRIYRGDSTGLFEVPLQAMQRGSELTEIDLQESSGSRALNLGDLFEVTTVDRLGEIATPIDAAVFADGDISGLDWADLSLSAAGITPANQSRRVFTGDTTPTALKALRTWAAEQLSLKGATCGDLALVVSELATNVERYAPGWVMVDLVFYRGMVLVAVTDRGMKTLPQLEVSSIDDASGRGLWIVAALSIAWGVVRGATSKTVWSLLSCEYGTTAIAET